MNIILRVRRLYYKLRNKLKNRINEVRLIYRQVKYLNLKLPLRVTFKCYFMRYDQAGINLPDYPSDIKLAALLIVNRKSYLNEYLVNPENVFKARVLQKYIVELREFTQLQEF